jgi:hypothetical protein
MAMGMTFPESLPATLRASFKYQNYASPIWARRPISISPTAPNNNHDGVKDGGGNGKLDLVAILAKLDDFIKLRPCPDGNGLIFHLILNVLLLKYGGMLVSFWEGDGETYLELVTVAAPEYKLDVRAPVQDKTKHYPTTTGSTRAPPLNGSRRTSSHGGCRRTKRRGSKTR